MILFLNVWSFKNEIIKFVCLLQEDQYAKWMAACRLAAKGRTLADSSYEHEVQNIRSFLQMQHPAPAPAISPTNIDINVDDYVAPKFVRKLKGKVMTYIFSI